MSSDGFPAAYDAMAIGQEILTVAHRRDIPLPAIELRWYQGTPQLDVRWYPLIDNNAPVDLLVEAVEKAFVTKGESLHTHPASSSYETEIHGLTVDFTVYHNGYTPQEGHTP